jgi:hypothetical protein
VLEDAVYRLGLSDERDYAHFLTAPWARAFSALSVRRLEPALEGVDSAHLDAPVRPIALIVG